MSSVSSCQKGAEDSARKSEGAEISNKAQQLERKIEARKQVLREPKELKTENQAALQEARDRTSPILQNKIRHMSALEILREFFPQASLSNRSETLARIQKVFIRALAHYHPDRMEIGRLPLDDRLHA